MTDYHLICTLQLVIGATCRSKSMDGSPVNTTFTYTLNSWDIKKVPWEELVVTTSMTPIHPSGTNLRASLTRSR
jgi:hypothetical protein